MFRVDTETGTIELHRGDTGVAPYRLKGYTLGPNDRVLWTMKDSTGSIIKDGVYTPENNEFRVEFLNGDTDYLAAGVYYYDARVVIGPEYDTSGKIIDGTGVSTPISPLKIIVYSTVGQI